jgi:hypothetical protein
VKINASQSLVGHLKLGTLAAVITLASAVLLSAAPAADTNSSPAMSTNAVAMPAIPSVRMATDDDDDAPNKDEHNHSTNIVIHSGGNGGLIDTILSDLIPILGILVAFGSPVLIVYFVCYFKYKRRQDSLAIAREYLNKGMLVPPQLLDPSQSSTTPVINDPVTREMLDTRRGFKLTFAGLAIALALLVYNPHSRDWCWGLIPLVIGIGFMLSGWLERRLQGNARNSRPASPPNPGDRL